MSPEPKPPPSTRALSSSSSVELDSIAPFPTQSRASHAYAPSYAESQFDTIIRRQRIRAHPGALKIPHHQLGRIKSSDDPSSSSHDPSANPPKTRHEHEFSGWGSMSYLDIPHDEVERSRRKWEEEERKEGKGRLEAWMATGVAGVAVAGSPFYAFPPLVAVAGTFSPISLLVATLLLGLWRPILNELAGALPQSGSNYIYLLNAAPKCFAVLGATVTLLDSIATSVVSAATAATYIADQVSVPFNEAWLCVLIVLFVGIVGLLGVKESAGVQTGLLSFHLGCMAALFIAACVHWGKIGNEVLRQNWHSEQPGSASGIASQIFMGVCIGFLGVTGFESTPDFISTLRPGVYPSVLLNLQLIATALNAPLMLVTFAVLPAATDIMGNGSVLNSVAKVAAGDWLKVVVTIDACVILAGSISASAVLVRLADDRILPKFMLARLPRLGTPYVALVLFIGLCLVVWGACGANLTIVSGMFAIVFLATMACYPFSHLLLAFSRPYLPRPARSSLLLSLFVLVLSLTLIGGNAYLAPETLGYFINRLFEMILYVKENEETSCVKLVHFYSNIEDIPSELEANYKILDEAFPSITVDLIFLQGEFAPPLIKATADRLGLPLSLCFVGCPRDDGMGLQELGVRIVN
ncbi:amino acid transmembrane transporter [Pseudohyphozyma bogoriensis]|nr:amino acid transmembrane transporter [Pseudohyphozyma bogoriensis]